MVILPRCLDLSPAELHIFQKMEDRRLKKVTGNCFARSAVDLPRRLTVKSGREPYFTHDRPSGFQVPSSGFSSLC